MICSKVRSSFRRPSMAACLAALIAATTTTTTTMMACTAGLIGDSGPTGSNVGGTPNTGPTIPGAKACTPPPAASNFHRLNAKQYQESVNQVLGLVLPLQQDLPQDASLYGFDNNADTSLTAALTQRYLDAAKKAVAAALADPAARAKLVTCDLKTGASCVHSILSAWLPKVFRRPVLASEVDAYQSYLTTCASS